MPVHNSARRRISLLNAGPGKSGGVPVQVFRIRPEKSDLPFDPLPLSAWLAGTLRLHAIERLGDLDGRRVLDLRRLRRLGPTQLRELYRILVELDALDLERIEEDTRAATRDREPFRSTPPYEAVRHELIAIRADARAKLISSLPWPEALRSALHRARRFRLGDLHGLTFAQVFGADMSTNPARSRMRTLHGWLALAGVRAPTPPPFQVPARVRDVLVDDVPMPRPLRNALGLRGVRTLGDLASLTPERLGKKFGYERMAALVALVAQASEMRPTRVPFARAIEGGLARLAPRARRVLLLRFGASGGPLTVRAAVEACGWRVHSPDSVYRGALMQLRDASGVPLGRALRELRARAGRRRSRLTDGEVGPLMGLASGRLRYTREFYLRLLGALEPQLRVAVVWGKRYSTRRSGRPHRSHRPAGR
jgi:hypothetical protein